LWPLLFFPWYTSAKVLTSTPMCVVKYHILIPKSDVIFDEGEVSS
jgi:hypothetical protein